MIQLVEDSILKNTRFMSNMQGALVNDHFEAFKFCTEEEVTTFGRLLELKVLSFFARNDSDEQQQLEQEFAEKNLLVNDDLLKSIDALVEYLAYPESYISADYVKEEAAKSDPQFTLSLKQKELSEDMFAYSVDLSFQQEIANFILERASVIKAMDAAACLQAINQSTRYHHQVAMKKVAMDKVQAPKPNERRSTAYPMELINLMGGEDRFEQLLAAFAHDKPFFEEVKEVNGGIHCKIKDEDGLHWDIKAEFEDPVIKLTLSNFNTRKCRTLDNEEVEIHFEESTKINLGLAASMIPAGAYQLSIATIKEILTTYFKRLATTGLLQVHLVANRLPDAILLNTVLGVLHAVCPSREQIPSMVRGLRENAPALLAAIAGIQQDALQQQELFLRNLLNTQANEREADEGEVDENRFVGFSAEQVNPAADDDNDVAASQPNSEGVGEVEEVVSEEVAPPVTPLRQLRRSRSQPDLNDAVHQAKHRRRR